MQDQTKWPILFKTSSANKEQQWEISIVPVDGSPAWDIVTNHGQVGGAIQESRVRIEQGKNIGRSNETSPQQQAQSEALSKWRKQFDKGYSEERGGAAKDNRPMLAHPYEEHLDKVDYSSPAYVQPKLDGQRCIAVKENGKVSLTSRNNKPIGTVGHIVGDLERLMQDGEVWDGELYCHDLTFQQTMSAIKKVSPTTPRIQYHVYDVVDTTKSFAERFWPVKERINTADGVPSLRAVNTDTVGGANDIWMLHAAAETDGYEGIMLRHGGCQYRPNARSQQLLKIKKFQDAEFPIVDVIPGERSPTHAVFVCAISGHPDVTFNVTPEGPHQLKEQYLLDREKLIGKRLTVKFFEMTSSEVPVPRFPIGKSVREDE